MLGLVILPTFWSKAVLPDQRFGSGEGFCLIWKRQRKRLFSQDINAVFCRFISLQRFCPSCTCQPNCQISNHVTAYYPHGQSNVLLRERVAPGAHVVHDLDWDILFCWGWLWSDPPVTPWRTWGENQQNWAFFVDMMSSSFIFKKTPSPQSDWWAEEKMILRSWSFQWCQRQCSGHCFSISVQISADTCQKPRLYNESCFRSKCPPNAYMQTNTKTWNVRIIQSWVSFS